MKRIIFGVIVFLAFISFGKADTTLYRLRYNNGTEVKYKTFNISDGYFDLFLDKEVQINNYQKIHNIAYYANDTTNGFDIIMAQVMIWEEVYPNYSLEVLDQNNNVVNLNSYRKTINNFINKYSGPCDINGYVTTVVFDGSITYVSKNIMEAYSADKYRVSISDKFIHISKITGIGTNTLNFRVIEDIKDNKIRATAPNMGDFSTTIILVGNKINFIVAENDSFIFDMYNKDTNKKIGTYIIDSNNNYIEYRLDTNVILKDKTNSSIYELFDDIIIDEDDSHTYTIELFPKYHKYSINFIADKVNDNYSIVNVDIYDINNNYIDNLSCNSSCSISLNKGKYIIKNKNTQEQKEIDLQKNIDIDVSNNYLKALKGSYNINKIYVNNKEINYHIDGEYIILDEYINSNSISLLIDNVLYSVELDELVYDQNIGLIKVLNIDLEDDIVTIEIPNTEDNKNELYFDYKKKYYYHIYNSNHFM